MDCIILVTLNVPFGHTIAMAGWVYLNVGWPDSLINENC